MGNLLSGLEKFGLGNLENVDIFSEEKKKRKAEEKKENKPELMEADLLFDKTHKCPVCENDFKAKAVKIGKAKLIEVEMDLRPKYKNIDSLKYDAIVCPYCGYAALSRFFEFITSPQVKLVKDKICVNYRAKRGEKEFYSYDDAIENHKLALLNAIVKKARVSERAYICLKLAWIIRGKAESILQDDENYNEILKKCHKEEAEYIKNAYEGFKAAITSETYPMCGMDETTVDYLVAVLAMKTGSFDIASKLVSGIITSRTTNKRMKEKALNLKEELIREIKEKKKVNE